MTDSSSTSAALVVGIGASAGGLHAFEELLSRLGSAPGVALVFVQHLDPSSESLLAELLAKATDMDVVQLAVGHKKLNPNTVYVCPPHALLTLTDGFASVFKCDDDRRQFNLIDHFFQSIAEDQGERGIGIILSGAGSDGTLGLKAISDRGGLTFAQEAKSAKYDSMPRSAATNGVADHVLPPAEIATELLQYVEHLNDQGALTSPQQKHAEIEAAIPDIADALFQVTQHNFQHYKTNTLVRRVQRRMQVLKMGRVSDYVDFLSRHDDEAQSLFRELLIGVTAFFRDPEVFETLQREVLPKLFADREPSDCVRIWVAGCANGAEAYTLAMLCREVMDGLSARCRVQIFATDIDERALAIGRAGVYPIGIQEQISPHRLQRFFVKRGKRFHVTKELRELVLFSSHNLISDPPFSRQDLISCRNLLIYLGPHLQHKLIPLFHHALRPAGYLLLGPSENISSHAELFRPVDARLRISQRKKTVLDATAEMNDRPRALTQPRDATGAQQFTDLTTMMHKIVLDEFTPESAIIDETGLVLTSSPNINKYLNFMGGPPQSNVLKLAARGLKIGLRAAIAQAKKTTRRVQHENLSVRDGDKIQRVMVTVQPMPQLGEDEPLYLVVFHEVGLPIDRDAAREHTSVDASQVDSVITQLEAELETTRNDLDRSIQDMEAANEELKSSNEELLSMNEELQSANEELETSKEAIRASGDAIARAHDDLQNLLQSTQIATVFLDNELRIRSFTPAISNLYSVIPTDVGRPLDDFLPRVKDMPPLPDIGSLRAGKAVQDTIVSNTGKAYMRRVLPYQSRSGESEGIVVTFTDISELRQSEALVRTIAENSTHAMVMMDDRGYVTYCNEVLLQMTGYDQDEIRSAPLHDLIHHHYPDGRPYPIAECPIDRALPDDFSVRAHEDLFFRKDGSTFEVLCAASPIFKDGKPVSTVVEIRDVTAQNAAQRALIETQARLDMSMEVSDTALWNWNIKTGQVIPNENLNRLFGFELHETPNTDDFLERIDAADRLRITAAVERGIAGESNFEEEYQIHRPDGESRWLRGRGRFLQPPGKEVEDFFGVITDITDRKRAELELAEAKRKLDLAMHVSGIAIWALDLETQKLIGDESLNQLIGFAGSTPPSLAQFIECIHPDDRDRVSQAITSSIQEGAQYDQEYRVELADGGMRWLRAFGRAVAADLTAPTELTGVVYDVTGRKQREVELADREAHLRRVINNQIGLVGVIDRDGRLQEIDDRSIGFAQTRREEVIGKHFADTPWWNYDPAVAEQMRDAMQRAFAGEVVRYDVSLFAPGEDGVMVDFMIAPVKNDRGEVEYLISSGVDIRERKAAEIALEQRARLAELHTSLAIALSSDDSLEKTLQTACQHFVDVLGVAFARIWLFDNDDAALHLTAYAGIEPPLRGIHESSAIARFKIEKIAQPGKPLLNNDLSKASKLGDQEWVRRKGMKAFAGYPLLIAGRVVGVLAMFSRQKITEVEFEQLGPMSIAIAQYVDRLQYAKKLAVTAQRTKMALRAGGMAAWEWTPEKSHWTPELYELLGVDPAHPASPELFFSLIHPDDIENLQRSWQAAIEGTENYYGEFRIKRTDGEERWLVGIGELVCDAAGNVVRMYGVNWDATHDRLQEEALRESERRANEASESKSEFLANMSHEIRTPMTAILGYADLIRDYLTDPIALGHLQTIRRNGDYLLDIINDILDLSKIEAGKLDIENERFQPARVLEDVRSIMEVRAHEGGLSLEVEYDGPMPKIIESDAKRLKQILINLVGNAIKFTPEGRVNIRVRYDRGTSHSASGSPTHHPRLHFDVIDTGIGMSSEQQAKLFSPFSQGDASVTRDFGGTGLGLAISKRLAEMLGGEITASSTQGVGSTFTVSISTGDLKDPELVDYSDGVVDLAVTSPSQPETPTLHCHVLIVDDRRDIRFLSRMLLTRAGATVDECEDGLLAVEHMMGCLRAGNCPDLILLDMQMPNLDGYQTARKLRELGYTGPIIALTADAMQGDMNECLEAGCNDYLSKPIDAARLLELVGNLTAAEKPR